MNLKKGLPIIAMLLVALMPGCKKDTDTGIYPVGTSSHPSNNATSVARNKVVAFTFSEAMDPSTVNAWCINQWTDAGANCSHASNEYCCNAITDQSNYTLQKRLPQGGLFCFS